MARAKRSLFDEVLAEAGFEENLPKEKAPEPEPVKEPEPAPEPVKEPEPEPEPVKEPEPVETRPPAGRVAVEPDVSEPRLELSDNERDRVLKDRLRAVLDVPRVKGQIPLLVRFRQDGMVPLRAVLVELGEVEFMKGWDIYKSFQDGKPDPERYLMMVYDLTQHEIPRLYRTVAEVKLE